MKTEQIDAIEQAVRSLESVLKRELVDYVDGRIEQHRRAVYVGDAWCCVRMRTFAVKCWGAPEPRTGETLGNVAYQLRGETVNYCPFCGASFLRPTL